MRLCRFVLAVLSLIVLSLCSSRIASAQEYACGSPSVAPGPEFKYRSSGSQSSQCPSPNNYLWTKVPTGLCTWFHNAVGDTGFPVGSTLGCNVYKDTIEGSGSYAVAPKQNANGSNNVTVRMVPLGGGDDCWNAAWSSFTVITTNTVPPTGCDVCPEPMDWDPVQKHCVIPECESGEVWDESIAACRAECTGDDFYHYASAQCRPQCPVGKSFPGFVITNGVEKDFPSWPRLPGISVPTVNGCKITHYYQCVADIKAGGDPSGVRYGYFRGSAYTGLVCNNFFMYSENAPVDMVSQQEWEEATGRSGFYEGHSDLETALGGIDLAEMPHVFEGVGSDAADITEVFSTCQGGVQRLSVMVNGVLDESIFLGACGDTNEDINAPGLAQDPAIAAVQQAVAEVGEKQDEQAGVLDAIQSLADDIKGLAQRISTAVGADEEEEPGEGGTFSGPAADGDAYTATHEDGLSGVIQDAQDALDVSDFDDWRDGLVPMLPSDVPACLTFTLEVPFYDRSYPITPDCRVWDWLRIIFLASTLAGCYGVVLGRN